jgi:hypothetical protein
LPVDILTDGIVVRPNDAEYAFENKDEPEY